MDSRQEKKIEKNIVTGEHNEKRNISFTQIIEDA